MRWFGRPDKTHDPEIYSAEIAAHGGYCYTVSQQFSTVHANRRLSQAILSAFDYRGKRVIDIGCGDGTYTAELFSMGKPAELLGCDPATAAVASATKKFGRPGLEFAAHGIYHLPFPDGHFDIAVVRGVIHHLDEAADGVREAVRVAQRLVFTDPNGYNPGVKLIEKISPYYRQHHEMSYTPAQYNSWLTQAGARLLRAEYLLLVPFFSPDWMAKPMSRLEPFVERQRWISWLVCGTHLRVAENLRYTGDYKR